MGVHHAAGALLSPRAAFTFKLTSAGRSPDPPGFKTGRETVRLIRLLRCLTLVMGTFGVVAMPVEELPILVAVAPVLGARDEVVVFDEVLHLKIQSTPRACPL